MRPPQGNRDPEKPSPAADPERLYEHAIDQLVRAQAPGEPAFRPEATGNPAYTDAFILEEEAGYFHRELVQGSAGLDHPFARIRGECLQLAREALSGCRNGDSERDGSVFMHRDFQCRNLMVVGPFLGTAPSRGSGAHGGLGAGPDPGALGEPKPYGDTGPSQAAHHAAWPRLERKEGAIAVIDLQGARLGPPEYDLASLLLDPYASLPDSLRQQLLRRYLQLASHCRVPGVPLFEPGASTTLSHPPGDDRWGLRTLADPRGDWRRWHSRFLASAANRLMQALGAFAKLGGRLGRPGFLEHIPEGLSELERVLQERGDCPALLDLVRRLRSVDPPLGSRPRP